MAPCRDDRIFGIRHRFVHARTRVRPPPPAQRVLDHRRHRADRRRGGARPRTTACRRSRSPTWPTCSAWSSSTSAARGRASSRSSAATSGSPTTPTATSRHALLLLCRNRAGYLQPVRAAVARVADQPAPRPRRDPQREWLADGRRRGPDRAVRRAGRRRRRRRCSPDNAAQAERLARGVGAHLPRRASTSRCSAPASPSTEALRCARRSRSPRRLRLPVVATHPVQFLVARGVQRARGARLHRRGLRARRPAPAARVHRRSSTSRRRPRWPQLFADLPAGARQRVEIARRCNLRARARQDAGCRTSRRPTGVSARRLPARSSPARAWTQPARGAVSGRRRARAAAEPRYRERLEFEIEDHHRRWASPATS